MSDLPKQGFYHLVKAFAPKAQACECEATGDNAKGDAEGVTR
jgi:hypothetical protein